MFGNLKWAFTLLGMLTEVSGDLMNPDFLFQEIFIDVINWPSSMKKEKERKKL